MPATAKAESAVAVLRHGKDPHGAVLLPPIWRPIAIGGARFAARGVIWLRPEQWERSPENASGSRTRASALPIRRPRWRTPLRHARSARRLRRVRRAPRRGVAGRRLTTCLKPQDCSRVQGGYFAQATCLKVLVCSRGQARYIPASGERRIRLCSVIGQPRTRSGARKPDLAALKLRECVGFLARATQPRAPRTDPRSCPTRSAKRGAPRPRLGSRRALDVMLTGVLHQVAPRGGRRKRPRERQDWKTRHRRPFTTWSST